MKHRDRTTLRWDFAEDPDSQGIVVNLPDPYSIPEGFRLLTVTAELESDSGSVAITSYPDIRFHDEISSAFRSKVGKLFTKKIFRRIREIHEVFALEFLPNPKKNSCADVIERVAALLRTLRISLKDVGAPEIFTESFVYPAKGNRLSLGQYLWKRYLDRD
jgi:hypothetical protein